MKTDVIEINSLGFGFDGAIEQTRKAAAYRSLSHDDTVLLQLLAEEMLSMAHGITGEIKASFWLEAEGLTFALHLTCRTVMDKDKRSLLIDAASSHKNDAARGFLSRLRDRFEEMLASDPEYRHDNLSSEDMADIPNLLEDPEWDGYEKSVLRQLADEVRIGIRGDIVDMTVIRTFAK